MFSVITNIYNKKTKGPILTELFTATGKLKKLFFFTITDVRCVHHGSHGTHRYDIQVLATRVNMCTSIFGTTWKKSATMSQSAGHRPSSIICRMWRCGRS